MSGEIAGGMLALAVAALWLPGTWLGRSAWQWLTVVAFAAAWWAGVLDATGAGVAVVWFGAVQVWASDRAAPRGRRALEAIVVLVAAAALMMHALPGFANPRVIGPVRFTPDAMPFSLFVNFDKTLIALGLLGLAHARVASAREWRGVLHEVAKWAPLTIAAVLTGSFALGYVRWAPKLPAEAPLWLAVNLLFTCTAEEALFRGFVQGGLRRAWANVRGGKWLALAVGAMAFGLAHVAGGWKYVALATVAGAGYGWVYERTQRVEASALAHWALNTLQFFLFTYPALAR
ncbi:MAG: CPBP family intramembrane metalloprotease [Candidatus Didemnitutus sp.]|nr:CPBP family intramembrane metalloprotease [Candidatus Didemnitutus sp.]